ncbi:MAG: V-type ATP synthase subunit E [bacterium]
MSYDGLWEVLNRQIEQEKEEVLRAARKEASQIIEAANKEADRINQVAAQEVDKLKKTAEAEKQAEQKNAPVAAVLIKASKAILDFKHKVINQVYQEAEKELEGIRKSGDYSELLKNLIRESSNGISGKERLLVAEKDLKLARECVKSLSVEVKVEAAPEVKSGVRLTAAGDKVKVDNTMTARIERVKPHIVCQLGKILYG